MRPFGASTPALLISTSSRPKRSTAQRDDGLDVGDLAHVGGQRLDRAAMLGQAGDGGVERRVADVAQHDVGVGLARELAATARRRASRPRR